MSNPIVDSIEEYRAILASLNDSGNISLSSSANNIFCKSLILSCASYYESILVDLILSTASLESNRSKIIASMVKKKVTDRQYHTYFEWKAAKTSSINSFLGLFGDTIRDEFQGKIKLDKELESSVIAFMELGGTRNQLVHLNFVSFPLQKTFDEVVDLYNKSGKFIAEISTLLKNKSSNKNKGVSMPIKKNTFPFLQKIV